jgi:hypothetical protein
LGDEFWKADARTYQTMAMSPTPMQKNNNPSLRALTHGFVRLKGSLFLVFIH